MAKSKGRSLLDGVREQRKDPGLIQGKQIFEGMDGQGKKMVLDLSKSVGADMVSTLRTFSPTGVVGRAMDRSARVVSSNPFLCIPDLSLDNGSDVETLAIALFDSRFQRALYSFQLVLSQSNLEEQQFLVKKFAGIDWERFNAEDKGFFQQFFGLISAGAERNRVHDLKLEDIIPLMKVPSVLDMIRISVGYARMMDSALESYTDSRDFLIKMGTDNDELLREIDSILERIKKAEVSRLVRLNDVVTTTDNLKQLLDVANLIADLTDRTEEAEAQKKAGEALAEALKAHSQDTIEAQEAYLEQFMRLNQILVSNQMRESHLQDAMAALSLYVKADQAFVLILTSLQVYLLTASSAIKKCVADSLEGSSQMLAEQIYKEKVEPLNRSVLRYSGEFARVLPGQSRRPGAQQAVVDAAVVDTEVAVPA